MAQLASALFITVLFLLAPQGYADFQVPALSGPVVDQAHFLGKQFQDALAKELLKLKEQGGPQIQVVTVVDLGGLQIEQAAIKIADAWKLGDEKKDDGVILLVARSERKVRIEVGQGLEGALPDVIAKRIIEQNIIPQFKAGNPEKGILYGVSSIIETVMPEYQGQLHQEGAQLSRWKAQDVIFWLFTFVFIFFGFIGRFSTRRTLNRSGIRTYGGYGGYSGGGGFGGGGGSSWSGGGGGFSGGGASGGW